MAIYRFAVYAHVNFVDHVEVEAETEEEAREMIDWEQEMQECLRDHKSLFVDVDDVTLEAVNGQNV